MNSLEIQYFLTIVKYGSFTEAAQALSVSQPAICKQIRQLGQSWAAACLPALVVPSR